MLSCFQPLVCPAGHRYSKSDESTNDTCDLCGELQHRFLYCKKCNYFGICMNCWIRLEATRSIMCPVLYHGGYFPTCWMNHLYHRRCNYEQTDVKCARCEKNINKNRHLFYCSICKDSICVPCYQIRTRFNIHMASRSYTACTFCRLSERILPRVRETCKKDITCRTCSAKLKGMTSFRCAEHELSVICLRCHLKERRGIILPREHGIALSQEDSAKLDPVQCRVCLNQKCTVVFQCGHTACKPCAKLLKKCHICREDIKTRSCLFI